MKIFLPSSNASQSTTARNNRTKNLQGFAVKTFKRSPASLFTSLLLAASLGAGLTLTGQTHAQSAQADSSAKMAAHAKAQYPMLSRYATDLTRLARQGRLEALAGHDAEIK